MKGGSRVEKTTRQIMSERLLLRRRQLGLSQQELAERCGFPYQVISGLERGRQSIYAERLKILAQALGVSTDFLLGLSDQEDEASPESELEAAGLALVGA
jgi:transcriptional regulator with XRE-family HTH domain